MTTKSPFCDVFRVSGQRSVYQAKTVGCSISSDFRQQGEKIMLDNEGTVQVA